MPTIAILDDDHILRLIRYAIAGPGEVTQAWAQGFFLPEEAKLARVTAAGDGLHAADGVTLLPLGTDVRTGGDLDVLIFRRGKIDAALMDAHPRLRLIQRIGERADQIDLAAAKARQIAVSCVPRPSLQLTAEHAMLLMLALGKRLIAADAATRAGAYDANRVHPDHGVAYNWTRQAPLAGLYGKSVGIVGMGEVGGMLARMAGAFGARVLYCNRTRLPPEKETALGVDYRALDALLAEADFVSLNASNLPDNKGMIDAKFFAAMKRTAYFVNTSRGRMVDEAALAEALTRGTIAGAGLDVFFEEPLKLPSPLATAPNVILTPHIAGGSRTGIIEEVAAVLGNCRAILKSGELKYRVA
ncbi:MAG TPA: NAD(P)-dependent oxidoreductase [Pseudolabrys sp.]|nr:NAD(P)-dependent oxidoreductase [Pseudolabrys sp.]